MKIISVTPSAAPTNTPTAITIIGSGFSTDKLLNKNPTMTGTGLATGVNRWIGDQTQGWGLGQVSSGTATGEYVTHLGEDAIKVAVTGLSRSGGAIGQVALQNLGVYAGNPVSTANLNINPLIVTAGSTYRITTRFFIESLSATTGGVNFSAGLTYYDQAGNRLGFGSGITSYNTISTEWQTDTFSFTPPLNAYYVVIRVTALPTADPTTDGAITFYVSDMRVTEAETALLLNGTNAYAQRTATTALVPKNTSCTLAVNTTPQSVNNGDLNIIVKAYGSTLGGRAGSISYDSTNEHFFFIMVSETGISTNCNAPNGSAPSGINYIVMATYEVTTGEMKLFQNGALVATATGDTTTTTGSSRFYIGTEQDTGTPKYYGGTIDNVRVWSGIVFTEQEATDYFLYNTNPYTNPSNLKLEWLFNENGNLNVFDASGNLNQGTGVNTSYVRNAFINIDNTTCTTVTVVNDETITCTTPIIAEQKQTTLEITKGSETITTNFTFMNVIPNETTPAVTASFKVEAVRFIH